MGSDLAIYNGVSFSFYDLFILFHCHGHGLVSFLKVIIAQKIPHKSSAGFFVSWLSLLDHLDVDCNAGREIEVREGFNHLRRGVHDIYEALMDAHFKLFARVLIDEGGAVDCPTLYFSWQWDWANDDGVEARGRIHNLLHR